MTATSRKVKKSLIFVMPTILLPRLSAVEPDVLIIESDKKLENSR